MLVAAQTRLQIRGKSFTFFRARLQCLNLTNSKNTSSVVIVFAQVVHLLWLSKFFISSLHANDIVATHTMYRCAHTDVQCRLRSPEN